VCTSSTGVLLERRTGGERGVVPRTPPAHRRPIVYDDL